MNSKLAFHDVTFTYDSHPILQHFSMDIKEGEFVSIIGPSGVGKSTLFQLATGLIEPGQGTISLDGNISHTRLGKVGYMPQRDLLMNWRTVVENAALPLEIQGISKKEAGERVKDCLPAFGLEPYADYFPAELSGGLRQRVSLLRATLTGASLLLLDEPFSALDGITRMEMQEWLLELMARLGTTVLMITHDLDEAILLADRVLVLRESPIREAVEVRVPIARPRPTECRHSPEFTSVREELWQLLRKRANARHAVKGAG